VAATWGSSAILVDVGRNYHVEVGKRVYERERQGKRMIRTEWGGGVTL
jgi:hypothetical protein